MVSVVGSCINRGQYIYVRVVGNYNNQVGPDTSQMSCPAQGLSGGAVGSATGYVRR